MNKQRDKHNSIMKQFNRTIKSIMIAGLTLAATALVSTARADTSTNSAVATPPKPDKLTTCPVSGEKLDGMGKPYVFIYEGQEVKVCCSGCKKDFDKDPAKYLKKIREADTPTQK
jgi:YHS domain-containing protein